MSFNQKLSVSDYVVFVVLTAAVCGAYFLYLPGLSGSFLLDDMWNLGRLNAQGGVVTLDALINFVFTNASGLLGRPVSMLSFVVNDQHWPSNAYGFKAFNLALHIIIGLLIFCFVFRLLKLASYSSDSAKYLSLIVAVAWLVHPFNVSTTLYVIQRMTQLSALFSLIALIFYMSGRVRLQNTSGSFLGNVRILLSLFFVALATLSKENGILALSFIILIEWLFFGFKFANKAQKYQFLTFVVFPIVLVFLYLAFKYIDHEKIYRLRDFTMGERLLTESRVVLSYIGSILVPNGSGTGLMHDDFVVSKSLFNPLSTVFAILTIFGLILVSILFGRKQKLVSFGILFFFCGHLLESTFVSLELYFEHRNYLPMIGVLLAAVILLDKTLRMLDKNLRLFLAFVFLVIYVGGAAAMTNQSTRIWGSTFDLLTFWATEHPDSLRAQNAYGIFLGKTIWYMEGVDVLLDAYEKFPHDLSLPMAAANIICKHELKTVSVDIQEFKDSVSSSKFHGGYITVAKAFGDHYINGSCADEENRKVAHALLLELENIPLINKASVAELTFYHAEKYAQQGDLDAAMELMERSYQNSKEVAPRFRQAQYLLSAGLYDDALEYIELAYEADELRKRKLFVDSQSNLIEKLEDVIKMKKDSEVF